MARITLTSDELLTVRDAMRGLNTYLDDLSRGEREKLVLTRHNQMLGVVLSVDRFAAYEELAAAANGLLDAEGNDVHAYNEASARMNEALGRL
jgi:hypothetical protein